MKRILITGASGFMGSRFLKYYSQEEPETEIDTISRRPIEKVSDNHKHSIIDLSVFSKHKPEVFHEVYHFAGQAKPNSSDQDHFSSNLVSTCNLFNMVATNKLFLASTIHAIDFNNCYGYTKAMSEVIVDNLNLTGINAKIFRFGPVVGKGMTQGVVRDFINKAKDGDPYFVIKGKKPGSKRRFVHITDVLPLIKNCWNLSGRIYNVAGDGQINLEKVAQIIMNKVGVKKNIVYTNDQYNDEIYASCLPIKTEGWFPKLNSEQAVEAFDL